jgi:hypothetical protein
VYQLRQARRRHRHLGQGVLTAVRAALLGVVLATSSACIPIAIGQPEWVTNRRPLPACGVERLSPQGGFDTEARRCLLDAWQASEDAELISGETTEVGNLVTRYLRVHSNGAIEIFVDTTQDAYGSGQWERYGCAALSPIDADGGVDAERVFVEEGCEPLPVP